MESIIHHPLLIDRVLKYLPFKHKVRLRRTNQHLRDAIQAWCRRHVRSFGFELSLRRLDKSVIACYSNFSQQHLVSFLDLSNPVLDVLIVDKLNDELWEVLQDVFYLAKEVHLQYHDFAKVDGWLSKVQFDRMHCESIFIDFACISGHSPFLDALLLGLDRCPNLTSIAFPRCNDLTLMNSIEAGAPDLLAKVSQFHIFTEGVNHDERFRESLLKFINLKAVTLPLSNYDICFPHRIAHLIRGPANHQLRYLRLTIARRGAQTNDHIPKPLLHTIWRTWPSLS